MNTEAGNLLFEEIKRAKSFTSDFPMKPVYDDLAGSGVLRVVGDKASLSMNEQCCRLLVSFLINEKANLKVTTITDAVTFTKHVVKAATDLGITQGTHAFRKHLLTEVIMTSFVPESQLYNEVLELKFGDQFRKIVEPVCLALPKLPVTIAQAHYIFFQCFDKNDGSLPDIYVGLEEYSKTHGGELLNLALNHAEHKPGFIAHILIGMKQNLTIDIWNVVQQVKDKGHEQEVIFAINRFAFSNLQEIQAAFNFLNNVIVNVDSRTALVSAYTSLYQNEIATPEIKNKCINQLQEFAQAKDWSASHRIITSLKTLDIPEEVRFDIASKLDFQQEGVLNMIGYLIKDFQPIHCFGIIRLICLAQHIHFDPKKIEYALDQNYSLFPQEFSAQLVSMLTDRIGFIRFGGSRILHELDRKERPFVFKTDLLSYSEREQYRFIESVMLDFLRAQSAIKFILPFRNSPYQRVLQNLVNKLASLTDDYLGEAIKTIQQQLDKDVSIDADILKIMEKYYEDMKAVLEPKYELNEFSPHKNHAKLYNLFRKRSKHRWQEQLDINKSADMNSIFSLFSKVVIARGKAWKLESNPGPPSELTLFSSGFPMPRTYFIDPDWYNWEIQSKILTDFRI